MANLLRVIQLGNPNLRRRAQPVEHVQDERIQHLIDDLIATAQAANGVGIAAPQAAQCDRLFIMASRPNERYPHAPTMEPTAIINPRILAHSNDCVKGWEGCLSIPGIRGLVPRYREIEVKYIDRWGDLQQGCFTDFIARIFQHEYDHLEGRVFLDRVESTQDLMTEQEYQSRIVASSSGQAH
ncbi:MAG: peptide deformylase [Leptolyngbyaceae cyanobacterium MO_188.B28]|nr:peptide deformylase [Leptolyngbyaceae cyanobacterium MO_188.B28]